MTNQIRHSTLRDPSLLILWRFAAKSSLGSVDPIYDIIAQNLSSQIKFSAVIPLFYHHNVFFLFSLAIRVFVGMALLLNNRKTQKSIKSVIKSWVCVAVFVAKGFLNVWNVYMKYLSCAPYFKIKYISNLVRTLFLLGYKSRFGLKGSLKRFIFASKPDVMARWYFWQRFEAFSN